VYGNALESCSQTNMALTGYTRTGSCVEYQDDAGSHHICIDLSSTTGGNFCTVTGQSDWCSSYMTCDTTNQGDDVNDNEGNDNDAESNGDNSSATCPVEDWCVCQWAFASYLEKAGGCDYIQDIKCEAINMEALVAYSNLAGGYKDYNGKYTNALNCIMNRCNVSDEVQAQYVTSRKQKRSGYNYENGEGNVTSSLTFITGAVISVVGAACLFIFISSKKRASDAAKKDISENNYRTIP
jgi:uncharacterized protein (DUF2237 family)